LAHGGSVTLNTCSAEQGAGGRRRENCGFSGIPE